MKMNFAIVEENILPIEISVAGMALSLRHTAGTLFQPMNIALEVEPIAVKCSCNAELPEPAPVQESTSEPEAVCHCASIPAAEPVPVPPSDPWASSSPAALEEDDEEYDDDLEDELLAQLLKQSEAPCN